MAQGGCQSKGSHQRGSEKDIGQITDCRVSQPPFPVHLSHCHGGTEGNGRHSCRHNHPLGPGSSQKLCSETEKGKPQDGEGARLDHGHRMEQSRHRRRRHGRLGKPPVTGKQGCLDTEAEKGQHVYKQQGISVFHGSLQIQHPSCHKLRSTYRREPQNEHQADKRKGGAAYGIVQVRPACPHGFCREGKQDQRQRNQRKHLIKQIQGYKVTGQGDAHGDAVGHGIEGEKSIFPLFMFHIFKCIQGCQRPQKRHQPGKHASHGIQLEHNRQRGIQPEQYQPPSSVRPSPYGRRHQEAVQHYQTLDEKLPFPVPLLPAPGMEQHDHAAEDREKDRKGQYDLVHNHPSIKVRTLLWTAAWI